MNELDVAKIVNERGFAIVRDAVPREIIDELIQLCSSDESTEQTRRKAGAIYGIRQLLATSPRLARLVASEPFIGLARAVAGEAARAVKGIFFDKTPEANWPVPWHQDVTITLQPIRSERQIDLHGFELRPVKDGAIHALPPIKLSEQMIALRIHLDDAQSDHGALRVIPGSHRNGRLDADQTARWLKAVPEEVCSVRAGDVMLMRPLLLHASSHCQQPGHRRVVHIEYTSMNLPAGLEWAG